MVMAAPPWPTRRRSQTSKPWRIAAAAFRAFTPTLAETNKKIKEAGDKPFEIVFISFDKDQGQFDLYYAEMPYVSLEQEESKYRENNARGRSAPIKAQKVSHLKSQP
jgi:hypothetical protein